jgi:pimeloyl-ACP methyl ester carboxylesterase
MFATAMETANIYHYRNLSISYSRLGLEDKPPLIILHGWGSNKQVMMPLAKELSSLRDCYVLDLPGFGNSSILDAAWDVDDYADLIETFLQDLEIEEADLLVHSFGGRIALKLCARPEGQTLINKVLITGGAGMKPRRGWSYYLKKYTAKFLKAPFYILPSNLREKALSWLRKTPVWQALGSSDYSKLEGPMRETFVKTVSEYLEPCLPHIPHEVLLLWGRNDESAPLYQAERMESGIDQAELVVIDHAGHYAFLDRPSHFASIAKAFFKG